ncbi:MAG: hypothetical protein WCG90_05605 [Chitinophagia bacterium]
MNFQKFTTFKTILIALVLTFNANQLFAQTTNGIFFQAVARDNFSNPAKDRKIFVQSSIIQSTPTGTKVLTEEHQANTDATGVFSISLGNGVRVGGTASGLATIDWSKGPFYLNLKVAITPIGGNSNWDYTKEWVDMGTTSFGAVPFALYSASAAKVDDKLNLSDTSSMLKAYAKSISVQTLSTAVESKLSAKDTLSMLAPYAKAAYTIDSSFFKTQLATKISIADSTKYITPTQLAAKTFDQTAINSAIASKLNIGDSTKSYVTPTQLASYNFSSGGGGGATIDTSSLSRRINLKANVNDLTSLNTNVISNTLSIVTQTTAIATKLNITDTSYLLKKTDTASLSNRINLKASISYVDEQIGNVSIADADVNNKGKIQLAGDLTGSAAAPTIANNAITNAKIATGIDASKIAGDIAGKASNVTGKVAIINGGTNAVTASGARTNLGLEIGTDVQAPLSFISPLIKNGTTISLNQATSSVDGYITASDFTSFSNKIDASQKAANNGIATLGNDGKIPSVQIPAISFQSASVVISEAAMLSLSNLVIGSIAIRTDKNKNFVLSATPSSTLSNWVELATPNSVTSVNSLSGPNVTLTSDNISEGSSNIYFTTARARAALSATSPLSYNASTGSISMTTASASNNGYLTATDFTTFNNKQNALTAEVDYVTPSNFDTKINATTASITSLMNNSVPYTGATASVNLGAYDLTVNGITMGIGAATITNTYNTAFGYNVLASNTTGKNNIANGNSALNKNLTGSNNLAIGGNALTNNTTGSNNTSIGYFALAGNIIGSYNSAIGGNALYNNTGGYNVALGNKALYTNTTGNYNTAIGYMANVGSNNLENATAVGNSAIVTASNTIQLGNANVTNVKTNGTLTAGAVTYPNTHGNSGQVLSTTGTGTLTWATASVPADASTSSTGMIQLSGDLGGTALSPTVNSVGGISSSTIGNFDSRINTVSNSVTSNTSSITSLNTSVNAATNTNTVNTIVKRDASGNFSAGTITAALLGNASTATTSTTAGNITATSNSTLVSISTLSAVGTITSGTISLTTDIKTAGKLLAGNVTYPNTHGNTGQVLSTTGSGTLTWTTVSAPSDASTAVKGIVQLSGDLGGTASSPTVNTVGGVSSSTIANFDTRITTVSNSVTSNTSSITALNTSVNAATNTNTVSTIVKRDASGNFSAGTITAALSGNATTATTAGNITATSNSTLVTISTLSAVGTITSGTISLTTDIKTAGKLVAGNVTYPNTHGNANQVLSTTGSGTLSWTTVSTVNIFSDEFTIATANQTVFNVANGGALTNAPLSSKVWMYINGTRISKTAYSVSGTTVTYDPTKNNGYTLIVGDRIQFDYIY